MRTVETRVQSEERRLVEAAQKEPHRFAELYESHVDRVYAYILRRVQDRTEAEDLTADVFRMALTGLSGYEPRGIPFAAWLFRIAANRIADRWHELAREAPPEEAAEPATADAEVERRAMLFQLVGRLPADQRRVIEARFAEQKSIREIAAELGRSEGAVKQLQFRALETLRAQMGGANG
jgi:RNA polymerase sigma-70 factor (ECF subfamily)